MNVRAVAVPICRLRPHQGEVGHRLVIHRLVIHRLAVHRVEVVHRLAIHRLAVHRVGVVHRLAIHRVGVVNALGMRTTMDSKIITSTKLIPTHKTSMYMIILDIA